jgi:thiamine-monophosphate kinase
VSRRRTGQIGEFELIGRYFRPMAGRAGLALGDDAAVLAPEPGEDWVVSTDMLVEGIDFLDDEPQAIAARALRVNLSDLAAKGAEPFAYLLGLGLRDDWTEDWVAGFAAGLARDHGRFGIELIGGDTSRSGERMIVAITVLGRLPAGSMVRRNGAMPGDVVVVTGTI